MRPFLRRLSAGLLAAVLCMGLCGCDGEIAGTDPTGSSASGTDPAASVPHALTLGYCRTDTLNPYTAKSKLNQEISTLLYDGLYTVSPEREAVPRLATSCVTGDNRTFRVHLRTGVSFSDGNSVTAEDVIASFETAKKSAAAGYQSALSQLTECVSEGGDTLLFTAKVSLPSIEELLTFPVFRAGSEEGLNEYQLPVTPAGTGRYRMRSLGDEAWLEANAFWCGGDIALRRIELLDVPDEEALRFYMEQGRMDFYYTDLSESNLPTYEGEYLSTDLTNLVFLQCNPACTGLDATVRRGIGMAVDRTALAGNAYFSQAEPVKGLFPEDWSRTAGLQKLGLTADVAAAKALFTEAGYEGKDNEGFYVNAAGERMSFSLLVSADNASQTVAAQQIVQQCAVLGISLRVNALPRAEYLDAVKGRDYDLYLGEMKLGRNLDCTTLLNFFSVGGKTKTYAAWKQYKVGEIDAAGLVRTLEAELPLIPLLYRRGVLINTGSLRGLTPSVSDLYYNLQDLT